MARQRNSRTWLDSDASIKYVDGLTTLSEEESAWQSSMTTLSWAVLTWAPPGKWTLTSSFRLWKEEPSATPWNSQRLWKQSWSCLFSRNIPRLWPSTRREKYCSASILPWLKWFSFMVKGLIEINALIEILIHSRWDAIFACLVSSGENVVFASTV